MSLPRPSFYFTIPSVYDGILLDCRMYHPKASLESGNVRAAIVAHPYAPLGGSYDDPVVGDIAIVLLREGYIVGLFNLRGAEKSEGRTSWSAKPELADYVSFYGFMLHYLHGLRLYLDQTRTTKDGIAERAASKPAANIVESSLILGGYSYGTLLAIHLPSVERVIQTFKQSHGGSSEYIIRTKATSLTKEWIKMSEEHRSQTRGRQRQSRGTCAATPGSLSVAFGDESTSRRTSRDSRRSLDIEGIRKSVDHVRARLHFGHPENHDDHEEEDEPDEYQYFTVPSIRYLLVSPLLGPVSGFLTMFSRPVFDDPNDMHSPEVCDFHLDLKPTLAIYGDGDPFTSKKKFRKWSRSLMKESGSRLECKEIEGAGHFWRRPEDQEMMQVAIEKWLHSTGHTESFTNND